MWKDFEVPFWGVDLGTPVVLWKVMCGGSGGGILWRYFQVPLWGDDFRNPVVSWWFLFKGLLCLWGILRIFRVIGATRVHVREVSVNCTSARPGVREVWRGWDV